MLTRNCLHPRTLYITPARFDGPNPLVHGCVVTRDTGWRSRSFLSRVNLTFNRLSLCSATFRLYVCAH
uniref:Uncharacterized protein n=1 Tax=Timema shepardi TaxID=629360 RepID=A0A7R9B938_TIMSH|nr:unnamed protein product [Timema shepardi]